MKKIIVNRIIITIAVCLILSSILYIIINFAYPPITMIEEESVTSPISEKFYINNHYLTITIGQSNLSKNPIANYQIIDLESNRTAAEGEYSIERYVARDDYYPETIIYLETNGMYELRIWVDGLESNITYSTLVLEHPIPPQIIPLFSIPGLITTFVIIFLLLINPPNMYTSNFIRENSYVLYAIFAVGFFFLAIAPN